MRFWQICSLVILGVGPLPGCVVAALFEEPVEVSRNQEAEDEEDAIAEKRDATHPNQGAQAQLVDPSEDHLGFATAPTSPLKAPLAPDLQRPCLDFFPGRRTEGLRACRGPDQVQIQLQGKMVHLQRRLLQARARDLVQAVMFRQKILLEDLGPTRLDLWLTASPFNAHDAGWTLVVWSAAGAWRVNLPFDLDRWRLDPEQVAIVSQQGYPSVGAWHPGRILLQARAHVKPERFRRFVADLGFPVQRSTWPVAAVDVRWFHEKEAVAAIKSHVAFREFVAFIQPQYAKEPDRVRRLFDRFNLKP